MSCITCKFLRLHHPTPHGRHTANALASRPTRQTKRLLLPRRFQHTRGPPTGLNRTAPLRRHHLPRTSEHSIFFAAAAPDITHTHPGRREAFPCSGRPAAAAGFPPTEARRGFGGRGGAVWRRWARRGGPGALRSAAGRRRRSPSPPLPPSALYRAPHVMQADVSILLHRHTKNISGNFHS